MTPPTRLERLVNKITMHSIAGRGFDYHIAPAVQKEVVKLLLRAQASQLARMRRIVKAQPKAKGYVDDLIRRDDLLAALRNGTR